MFADNETYLIVKRVKPQLQSSSTSTSTSTSAFEQTMSQTIQNEINFITSIMRIICYSSSKPS